MHIKQKRHLIKVFCLSYDMNAAAVVILKSKIEIQLSWYNTCNDLQLKRLFLKIENKGENIFLERLLSIQPTIVPVNYVAFYAYLSSSVPASDAHRIIAFDTVITNVGNAYHPHMGTLIAPKSGLYVFTWTIRLSGQRYYTTELVVNNKIINQLYFNPNNHIDGSVSSSVVVHVDQGDDVLIRTNGIYHNGEIISDQYGRSSFAGWILM